MIPLFVSPRALIVEDDAVNRRVLELMLELQGYEFDFAENGVEALEAFERDAFDLVLMDLQMPVMNGHDAIRGIRSFEAAHSKPRTPIVVVSAFTRPPDVEEAAAAGADDHLGKPLDYKTLVRTIGNLTQH
jgi:CheY-like chemotaxis protein